MVADSRPSTLIAAVASLVIVGQATGSTIRIMASRPGAIHLRIVEVMRRHPAGVTSGEIRKELRLRPDEQAQLDRRRRDLRKWYQITVHREGGRILYRLGPVKKIQTDPGEVSLRVRAKVIHSARGRCQMCGASVEKDGVKLEVDHKYPRDWGGTNDEDNLWAICQECNAGKKSYFASFNVDDAAMSEALSHRSVHVRIGELLKASGVGKPVPADIIAIVANQEDWQKRLRDLRYPVIGWKIDARRHKTKSGKTQVDYVLREWRPWPPDPTRAVREFERRRPADGRR